MVEGESGSFIVIRGGRHRFPGVAAILGDIGGICELGAIGTDSARNYVARVLGIDGDGGFVASVQAWIADLDSIGGHMRVGWGKLTRELDACIRNSSSETGPLPCLMCAAGRTAHRGS